MQKQIKYGLFFMAFAVYCQSLIIAAIRFLTLTLPLKNKSLGLNIKTLAVKTSEEILLQAERKTMQKQFLT